MTSYQRQLCLDQHGAAVVEWCQLLLKVLKQLGLIEQDLVQYNVQWGTSATEQSMHCGGRYHDAVMSTFCRCIHGLALAPFA